MKYSIRVNEVKNAEGNIRAFATIVFDNSFKITNIAILENRDSGQLFVSMPRYKTNERDENGSVYKDVCNPITKGFREELYGNILKAYDNLHKQDHEPDHGKGNNNMPEFSVSVTTFEREGSNIRGLARIYFEDSFIVNNVNILQGKDSLFVAMPSYKTKHADEKGKAVYQEVCYPVTKEFREKLYNEIIAVYERELHKQKSQERNEEVKLQVANQQNSNKKPTSLR